MKPITRLCAHNHESRKDSIIERNSSNRLSKLHSISDLSLRATNFIDLLFSRTPPSSSKIRVIFYGEVSIVDSTRLGHGINFFYERFLGASTKVIHQCQVLFNQASWNCVRARVYRAQFVIIGSGCSRYFIFL